MGSLAILFGHLKNDSFFYLLQNLMHWILEHSIDYLRVGRCELSCKVSPRSVVAIKSVRPEVPPLLRDNLCFTFTQLLVFSSTFLYLSIQSMS